MGWHRKPIFIYVLITFLFSTDYVFTQELRFKHLSPDQGLFSGNVRSFLQDFQGFMWVGTDDGLYRYDGSEMIKYRYEKNNPNSLSDNNVLSLFEDSNNNLWVGTFNGGLSLYDRKHDYFHHFQNNPNDSTSIVGNAIRDMFEDNSKNLYIASKGLSYFNLEEFPSDNSIKFQNVAFSEELIEQGNWISAIEGSDSSKELWIATVTTGVLIFDPDNPGKGFQPSGFDEKQVYSLYLDSKKRMWLGTWNRGVSVYKEDLSQKAIFVAGESKTSLPHNLIGPIVEDNLGNIWIATDEGLSKFDGSNNPFESGIFTTYLKDDYESNSLLSNIIKAIYIDSENRLWIGSYFGGINIYDPNLPKFQSYNSNINNNGSLSNQNVTAQIVDQKGRLWIATDGGGLNIVIPKDSNYLFNEFEKMTLINPISGKTVVKAKCITMDDEGSLWVGTWSGGLFKIDPDSKNYEHFGMTTPNGKAIVSDEVISIKAQGNNIWIGHFNGGLSYYDAQKDSISAFTRNFNDGRIERINSILLSNNPNEIITAQERGGINIYNSESGFVSSIHEELIPEDLSIYGMHMDELDNLWFGSSTEGLSKYNISAKELTTYNENDGLSNYKIHSILEDSYGRLWISTNNGLFQFDPEQEQFVNYTKEDGLQGNQYNQNSGLRLPDGTMIFGGTNGFDHFNPEEIKTKQLFPTVIFTHFWLNDEELKDFNDEGVLKENITIAKNIDLKYSQNSFSLGFIGLNFTQSNHNDYMYILEGFNKRWQHVGSNTKISFTNMEPGTYELKIKASNREKNWPEEYNSIILRIHPAWWQTFWFKIATITFLVLFGLLIHRLRLNYIIAQKRELEKLVDHRTMELSSRNNEILAQNEELISQNDHINEQRDQLELTQKKLKAVNEHLEELVDKRTKRLKKTVGELDRFVYSASHDLSAPLKSILGLLNIAKLEKDPVVVSECHRHIEASISKLDNVIHSLVDFSRNSHLKIAIQPFKLQKFVDEVITELAYWPEAQNIKILNEVPENFEIKTDSNRLKIVLYNLIGNSIKYSDPKKNDRFVKILATENTKNYIISVEDNGVGIEKKNQKKIFNMYYRASELSTGSGLGLFIVKETVSSLKGHIEINNSSQKGTSISILLRKDKLA